MKNEGFEDEEEQVVKEVDLNDDSLFHKEAQIRYQIEIKNTINSMTSRYMETAYSTFEQAAKELACICRDYVKKGEIPYYIGIKETKVRMLKNPISFS